LSLAPLLVLLLTITGWLGQDTQQQIIQRTQSLVSPEWHFHRLQVKDR